jgi:hypothetical protein
MVVPPELRTELEEARLGLRALYRAMDQSHIAQHLPPKVRRLFELDADFAEALWVLDQPNRLYNLSQMVRDIHASLARLSPALEDFLASIAPEERRSLERDAKEVRKELPREAAYLDIPGRHPKRP